MSGPLARRQAERTSDAGVSDARERRWADGIRAGDVAIFGEMFRELFPGVRVFLTGLTGPVGVAEELAQDVFVAVWDDRERLVVRGSLRAYIFAAARNRALNHLKRERMVERWVSDSADRSEPTVRDPAVDAELAEAIVDAVRRLPTQSRRMFMMNRTQNKTYGDIARALGVSVKTVETQMARALKSLRARLKVFAP